MGTHFSFFKNIPFKFCVLCVIFSSLKRNERCSWHWITFRHFAFKSGLKNKIRFSFFHTICVTRFGEISPLWQKCKNLWWACKGLWQKCKNLWWARKGLFIALKNYEPTLAKFHAFGEIFIDVNGQILKNNLSIWSPCLQRRQEKGHFEHCVFSAQFCILRLTSRSESE